MQQKVVFKSKGLNCSGLFYRPDNYSATDDVKLPAIAMAHGMGTTKEMGLPSSRNGLQTPASPFCSSTFATSEKAKALRAGPVPRNSNALVPGEKHRRTLICHWISSAVYA
jgi:hypothetical protein